MHPHRSAATAFALGLALALAPARPADAAVAVHGTPTCKSQAFFGFGVFTLSAPSGISVGDVMVATMRRSDLFSFGSSGPSGWTQVASVSTTDTPTYYKVATAGDVGSSWTFASMLGFTATMTGSIVAFSGADPAAPIGDGATATGSGTAVSLPAVMATRANSLRYSAVISATNATSTFSGGLSETCDQAGTGASISNAVQAAGIGLTPARTSTLTGSASWLAQTLVIQPATACATGGRALAPPGTITFPTTTLNGANQTVATVGTLSVSDMTDTAAGWNLAATSTTFTNGTQSLPAGAVSITGASPTAGITNCALAAANTLGYPLTLPSGTTAPPAAKVFNTALGSGIGLTDIALGLSLAIPANARIGTYTSTWTFTLAAGP